MCEFVSVRACTDCVVSVPDCNMHNSLIDDAAHAESCTIFCGTKNQVKA